MNCHTPNATKSGDHISIFLTSENFGFEYFRRRYWPPNVAAFLLEILGENHYSLIVVKILHEKNEKIIWLMSITWSPMRERYLMKHVKHSPIHRLHRHW